MDQHERRILRKIDDKLDCVLEVLDCLVEATQAGGDAAKIQAVTKVVNESTAKLKAKLAEVGEITGE